MIHNKQNENIPFKKKFYEYKTELWTFVLFLTLTSQYLKQFISAIKK